MNARGFGDLILFLIRIFNQLEIQMNCYERVIQYATLKSEPPATAGGKPRASWPTDGEVLIKNLSVKYASDGPNVLSNMTCTINSNQKIGICGRTGSGKSTLCLSLLRFTTKVSGSIEIDGIDIDEINLEDLRERICIIPQEPVLFSGTIRSNLDPFEHLDDAEMNQALRQSGFWDEKSSSCSSQNDGLLDSSERTPLLGALEATNQFTLDSIVTSNGNNFSQGKLFEIRF
jgi:ABC-type multidrug transport system fused ATPase/permease subunit